MDYLSVRTYTSEMATATGTIYLMFKQKKFWGITFSLGTVIGLSIAISVYGFHLASSKQVLGVNSHLPITLTSQSPKLIPLSESNPTNSSKSDLKVSNQSSNQGLSTGGNLSLQTSPSPTPNGTSDNGPDTFSQYDKYKSDTSAFYGDLVTGDGAAVAVNSTVTVQYRGWLTNGTEFDESYARGQAFSFVEGQHKVIAGWEEGLLGMKVGGTRRLIIPPSVGYGDMAQSAIPANSVLVFDIELISVQ